MHPEHLARVFNIPDLPSRLADVEWVLGASLEGPSLLAEPSRRVITGGKLLRPAFTIVVADLGAVYNSDVVAAAAAVELVQVGSLVHDDLLDGALTRRDTPTINAVEGAGTSVLTGDYMLARAGELAASVGGEAAAILARTIVERCAGQSREMAEISNLDRTVDGYLASVQGKTAKLFGCAAELGGLCARMSDQRRSALRAYGEHFGMAFQMLDDVLDLIGDPVRLGKPTGTDILAGVYTLPVLAALEEDPRGRLHTLLAQGDDRHATLEVAASSGIATALAAAEGHANQAAMCAELLADTHGHLASFPHAYLSWAREAFIDRRLWPVP